MNRQPEKGEAPKQVRALQGFLIQNANKERIMANSTQAAAGRAITVSFHGADLYVVEHNGQPYTPMKPVVLGMGLDWAAQFSKLKSNPARWGIAEIAIPTISGVQSMICLPLRKLFGWLSGINLGKIRESLRERVAIFQNECDDVLWQYWNEGLAINPRAFSVHPDQTLTADQAATLRTLLTDRVKKLPRDQQARAMIQGWSKLKAHFKTDYRHIPAHEFHEAVNILARHTAEWELVDPGPVAAESVTDQVAEWVKKIEAENDYPAMLFMPLVSAVQRKLGKRVIEMPPGQMLVDRKRLAALWVDLGKIRSRIDAMGCIESDFPPSWWAGKAIS